MNILTIGNSFSDDMMEYVWDILTDAGVPDVTLGNLYIGGCSLALHADNANNDRPAYDYRVNIDGVWHTTPETPLSAALSSRQWDIVSLQQASHDSGLPETYNGDLDALIAYVRRFQPKARLVWHMTWAYAANSDHGCFPRYHCDQMTMYRCITDAVQTQVQTRGAFDAVIPSGTSIQNARTSSLGDTLNRDGFHLSIPLGRYTAGLTLARTLCGCDLDRIGYKPEGVSAAEQRIAAAAATAAVDTPFAVTPLSL